MGMVATSEGAQVRGTDLTIDIRPHGTRMRRFAILACLFLTPSCEPPSTARDAAANQPSRATAVFPPQTELARLPNLPAPPEAFGVDAVAIDAWTAQAPPGGQDDPSAYDDPSPWGDLVRSIASAASAKGDPVRLSPALRCAASEIARFIVEKGGIPTESLRRFLVARCGATSPDAVPIIVTLKGADNATDAAIYEHTQAHERARIEERLRAGHHALGLGTSRAGGRFAVVAIDGDDEVKFETLPRGIDASRRALLRGRLRTPAASAYALVNRGDYATAGCDADPSVKLPDFAFSCELAAGDSVAWAQILVQRDGSVMSSSVADLLLGSADPAALEYRPHVSGPPAPVADAAGLSSTLLAAVNRVRERGTLAPLALAAKQSADETLLAGTFIDATTKGRDTDVNRIALGWLAGWDVDGMIRNGSFFVGLVAPTRDATVWLDFALERPFGRNVLLDPDARRIAIGPALPPGEARALGAVVSTYALFESANHDADVARIFARVKAERTLLRKAPLAPIDATPDMSEQAKFVLAGQREPMAALDAGMRSLAQRTLATVSGFVVEGNEIGQAPIPDAILHVPAGRLAITVTHHRVQGAAWGQYTVFYLLVTEGGVSVPSVQM